MKLDAILSHIDAMRDRDGLRRIIGAAEARDSKLGDIETERERARLWRKFEHLKAGEMVFIHTDPERTNSQRHKKLWGHALTIREVRPRLKEIIVRAPGSKVDHLLSSFTCAKLKLSKEPHPAAFANALRREVSPSLLPSPESQRAKNAHIKAVLDSLHGRNWRTI